MRISILLIMSVVLGLALGLGSTVVELGLRPDGSGHVAFGPFHHDIAPPPLATDGPPPKLVVDEPEFNFGRGERNASQHHEFSIRNAGQGALVLVMGKTSCKCTKAEIEHPNVPPGGSTKVTLEWETKTLGPFRQSATILANDPQQRSIDLSIAGEIVASYRIEPERVVLTSVSSSKPTTATARILSYGTTNLDVVSHKFSSATLEPFFALAIEKMSADELKEETGAKSGCVLRITVKPGLPAGAFEQRIHLHLNLPGEPEIVLPVEGRVNSPIEIVSRTAGWEAEQGILSLGQIRSAEGAKAELSLIVREGAQENVNIKLARTAPAPLKVTIGKREPLTPTTSRIALTIEVPRGARPVNHLGSSEEAKLARILLDTGLPEPKQLQILVQFLVEE
jgi:Protein of unknown function (DUF1573)